MSATFHICRELNHTSTKDYINGEFFFIHPIHAVIDFEGHFWVTMYLSFSVVSGIAWPDQ